MADGAQQYLSSMCCSSPAVSMSLHLAFLDPVMPIVLLIPFTLPFCVFSVGLMKHFLSLVEMHAEAPESQIVSHVSDWS